MYDADLEWREITRKQREVSKYKSSAEFFSIQTFVDKMMQNLKSGGISRVTDQLAVLGIPADSTVLDIGAEPGTLAVPLTGSGCRVTVVEPSRPMTLAMDQYRQFRNVDAQIKVIPAAWEDVDPGCLGRC